MGEYSNILRVEGKKGINQKVTETLLRQQEEQEMMLNRAEEEKLLARGMCLSEFPAEQGHVTQKVVSRGAFSETCAGR